MKRIYIVVFIVGRLYPRRCMCVCAVYVLDSDAFKVKPMFALADQGVQPDKCINTKNCNAKRRKREQMLWILQ